MSHAAHQKIDDPHFLRIHRIIEGRRRISDLRGEGHEQQQLRDIKLPAALIDTGDDEDEAIDLKASAIGENGE